MTLSLRLAVGLGAAGVTALAGAWVWTRLKRWRARTPAELERVRRLEVNRRGRIGAARILDLIEPDHGEAMSRLLLYKYEVAGVTYEVAQDVSALPEVAAAAPFRLGQTASVKYDPQEPANSIIACEEWCGLPVLKASAQEAPQPVNNRDES